MLLWPGDAALELDVTEDLLLATWRIGELRPNQFGTCMKPASGLFTLLNPGGQKYRGLVIHAGDGVERSSRAPIPVEVDMIVDGVRGRVFAGFSSSIAPQFNRFGRHIALAPSFGALGLVEGYHDKIYTRLQGNLFGGEIVGNILQDAGYTGESELSVGDQEMSSARIYRAGLLGGSRQRATTTTALKAVAEAEIGRIYDNRLRRIIFEGRHVRRDKLEELTA